MAKDTESRRWRAKQVGMLMRAYRRSYRMQGRDGRLSQSGLLDLMGRWMRAYQLSNQHQKLRYSWEVELDNPVNDRL